MIKNIFLVLFGFLTGILGAILFFSSNGTFSDAVSIFGTLTSATVLIYIASLLNKKHNNTNLLKNQFIKDISLLREDYLLFINDLKDKKCTKQQITHCFKTFSEDFHQLEVFLKQEFTFETSVQSLNRKIHLLICDNTEFDSLKPSDIMTLNSDRNIKLDSEVKDFKYLLTNLILNINKH